MPEAAFTPERWRRIKSILLSVLERPPNERDSYLDAECAGDDSLREDVQSLIEAHERSDSLSRELTPLAPRIHDGDRVAQYQIVSLAGRGGMGEVYLARDTVLGRNVAVKLLLPEFGARRDRIERFQREARMASALSHPNIITIYEVGEHKGVPYIVTEFVEGVTLRKRISEGFPNLTEILDIVIQVAAGLSAAHGAGVIHRDIKPENVMVRRDGIVKVLDFGLAKLKPVSEADKIATGNLTAAGALMGTPQYMSPEQALGTSVDARSDLFSLGAVIFEMTAGQPPFQGASMVEVLSRILECAPTPLATLRPGVPPSLSHLTHKALSKEPSQRFQSAAEMEAELRSIRRGMEDVRTAGGWRTARWPLAGVAMLTVILLGIAGYSFITKLSRNADDATTLVPLPLTTDPGHELYPSFSPDGKQVAFSWNGEKAENYDIYLRSIGSGTPVRFTSDPAEDTAPAWSPDGSSVAFVRRESNTAKIMLAPARGGAERKLGEVLASSDYLYSPSLSWSPDGRWLAVPGRDSLETPIGLWLISSDGGEKRRLTSSPAVGRGDFHAAFSPDGRSVAFVRSMGPHADDVYILSLGPNNQIGEPRRLTRDGRTVAGVAWTADSKDVVFSSNRSGPVMLWRVPAFSPREPQRLSTGENGIHPSISRVGNRLAYTQSITDTNIWKVNLSNPHEAPVRVIASRRGEQSSHYSPDGKRIAFESNRSGDTEIWLSDADGSNPMQLVKSGRSGSPRWSPDGGWVAFDSNVDGRWQIYTVSARGGPPRRVTTSPANDVRPSWSMDGKWIFFASNRSGGSQPWQIWKVSRAGGDPVQITRQGGFCPLPSLDGKMIYFAKRDSGTSPLWKVPVEGGEESQVLDSVAGFASGFAVARGGIFYFSGPRLQYLDLAKGISKPILTIGKPTGLGLAVSPDDRWLLYTQIDQGGSDLMLVEGFR